MRLDLAIRPYTSLVSGIRIELTKGVMTSKERRTRIPGLDEGRRAQNRRLCFLLPRRRRVSFWDVLVLKVNFA
jgi:hypothetical protein